ncbi:AraC family transcriptional regulator [Oceanispirochaeta crateris]|uniref:AraC family transcriptional regulator n=1 Tax=Oceanispirochaeta crateris TaxID=2518645 RepID=A0A5C1QRL4_9SPIO|nr:AraC family transcriptional regulator [Oceanispirochaeta crateris]QEN08722.1 AraC family transcriptional regulator [Oceanispirochaeta crateris]
MQSEYLQGIKKPNLGQTEHRLDRTGLALEYFPAFEQNQHDFHGHDFIEILFVLQGSFRHVTAESSFDESMGGLTIVNDRQYHSLRTPDGPVELMNIYLKPALYPLPVLPEPLASRLYELIPLHPELGNRFNSIRHLKVGDTDKIKSLLMMILEEQNREVAGQEAAIQALFRLFLIELCRAAPVREDLPASGYSGRIEKVCTYLEKNFTSSIRLDDLCLLSGLNPANLCRRFKEFTGMSTGEYLKQRRLAAAVQRLRMSNDKILTISHDCGFSDISRFNRFFREAFDCTPSAYRETVRDLGRKSSDENASFEVQ